jgi:NADP-dependent 3-hydroxy acid dehydrogenase YdfG
LKERIVSSNIEGITGKVVVITGASSGLGEAAARLLSAQGASVVLGARRTDRIQALADELTAAGGKALAVETDVTDRAQVQRLVDAAVQAYGRIDVIINNAGLMPQSLLERLKVDEWDRMIDVNIKGLLYGIAAVLPTMQRQQSGHIINTASVVGFKVLAPGGTVYSATKFAVRAITEGLRIEVKQTNIRTTMISPGVVATELPETSSEEGTRQYLRDLYRIAIPVESIAQAIAYAIAQPANVEIDELVIRPTAQEF